MKELKFLFLIAIILMIYNFSPILSGIFIGLVVAFLIYSWLWVEDHPEEYKHYKETGEFKN